MTGKLKQYLDLANDIRSLMRCAADKIDRRFQESGQRMTVAERVAIGFANKLHGAFEALVEDAGLGRAEAMHHLKTMVECFIYLYWVGQGTGDERATQVLAWACGKKKKFFKANPGYPSVTEHLKTWQDGYAIVASALKGKNEKKIVLLAKECGLDEYYARIYRLACEPAHIADIYDYMPQPGRPIAWNQTDTSELMAHVAIDYGVHLMCDLLEIGSGHYQLEFEADILQIRVRYNEARAY